MISFKHIKLFLLLGLAPLAASADNSVGTPKAVVDVNNNGAATYNLAIEIPNGGGFHPQIALAYNSQSTSYGHAGYGFNITGISVITSAGRDIYHDGEVKGATYLANSSFYLDGKKLLLESGTEGCDGATYTVEGNPYTKVTVHGSFSTSSVSTWFEVLTPDGVTYKYGSTASSRLTFSKDGKARCAAWYISSAVDKYKNTIEYNYMTVNKFVLPTSITYGKNTAKSRGISCSINFSYSDIIYNSTTDNVRNFYIGGVKGNISKKLSTITSTITSSGQTSVYRKYTLNYNDYIDNCKKKYTRLTSITESNADGNTYAPVKIEWNALPSFSVTSKSVSVKTAPTSSTIVEDYKMFTAADLNNDGVSDIVRFAPGKYEYKYGSTTEWYSKTFVSISLSKVDTNGNVTYQEPIKIDLDGSFNISDWYSGANGVNAVDFNGDGYADLMIPYYQKINNIYGQSYTVIYGSTSPSYNSGGKIQCAGRTYDCQPIYTMLDMSGNGKNELISLETSKQNGYYNADIIICNDQKEWKFESVKFTLNNKPDKIFTGDYNNDGLSDLIVLYKDGYKIFYNNGFSSNYAGVFTNSNSYVGTSKDDNGLRNYWRVNQGDFNGDGLVDFVCYNDWKLFFMCNQGNGTFVKTGSTDVDYVDKNTDKDDQYFAIRVADFDHDGLSDLMVSKKDLEWHGGFKQKYSYRTTQNRWYISDGNKPTLVKSIDKTRDGDDSYEPYIFIGDFDGDGYEEFANYGSELNSSSTSFSENRIYTYKFGNNIPSLGKVSAITDALTSKTNITYSSATNPAVYTKGTTSSYPVNSYTLPITVVSQVSTQGRGFGNTTKFQYGDLRVHLQGRGVLGFGSFTKTNVNTSIAENTTINTWNTTNWVPTKVTQTTTIGSNKSTSISNNSIATLGSAKAGKISKYFAYPSSTTVTDYDGNVTTTTKVYNTTKGVMTSLKISDDGGNLYKQETYTYPSSKIKNTWLPTQKKITQKHSDDSKAYSIVTNYHYNSMGNPDTIVCIPNGNQNLKLTQIYTYDKYGNKKSERTIGSNVKTIKNLYNYDSSGRFLTSTKTSPTSKYIVYKYNIYGDMYEEIDSTVSSNILVTSYLYNRWNELTKKIYPDNNYVTYTKAWDTFDGRGSYSITEVPNIGAKVKTIYDGAGREISSSSIGLGKIEISRKTMYSSKGYVEAIINKEGNHTVTETMKYDTRGRLTSDAVSPGTTTSYVYSKRKVSKTIADKTKTTTFDAWGNVKTITDNGGTINYTYNSNGKPSSIGGIKIAYDAAGNKTSLTDPDAGTMKYTYAADGTILTETDARGVVTKYTYDNLGRIVTTQIGNTTIKNTYKNGGYGNLQLQSQSMGSNVTNYTYDRYGRVITETRTVADKGSFTNSYTYNSKGQLSQRTFPGDLKVSYYYDINGFDSLIIANNKVVHRVKSNTGESNSLSTTYSFLDKTDITTTQTFSTSGYNTKYQIKNGSTVIDNYDEYRQLTTGNMLSRQRNADMPEQFQYDNCDRLVKVNSPSGLLLDMWYGQDGIMTYKSNVGCYSYDVENHAHAVSSINQLNASKKYNSNKEFTDFNDFGKISDIYDDHSRMSYYYGPDMQRWKAVYSSASGGNWQAVYFDDYEKITETGKTREFYYICDNVIVIKENGTFKPYLVFKDGLGSILCVRDENNNKVFDATYDAWGLQTIKVNTIGLRRGYTGHEHVVGYELINMNGRIYDPLLAQFLSPDNYVQAPDNSQNFNRYSYCINNPLKYTDPSGDSFTLAAIIGAAVGAYMGGTIANGTYNPTKWDFGSPQTWGFMICGGLVGAASGYVGAYVSASGIPAANTLGIMAGSAINSLGTYAYTLGETPITISAGIVSYDFTNGKFGYLGKKGNSKLENWMYGLGALANLSDILMGTHPQDVDLVTEHSDATGHSAMVEHGTATAAIDAERHFLGDPNSIISVGPDRLNEPLGNWHWMKGTNSWNTHSRAGETIWRNTLRVNRSTIDKYANYLNSRVAAGKFHYSLELSSCVTHTSNALNLSGIFNIGIHPYLLNAQMYLWSNGIRPWTICNYIQY